MQASIMKFEHKYLGKWVAVKNEKVIASDKTLTKLTKKMGEQEGHGIRFTRLPKGFIAG